MTGRREIDWNAIKTEYITTNTSQRKLAAKYGVSGHAIAERSKAEKWVEQRERYNSRAVAKSIEKSAAKESNRLARLITATTKAIDVAMEAFEDERQFHRYIITEGIGSGATETEEREFAKIDTKALKDLTGVLKDLTGLMRDYYNLPTPAQAEAQRIAAERLEMDKRKAEADAGTDKAVEVIIRGEAEDWAR